MGLTKPQLTELYHKQAVLEQVERSLDIQLSQVKSGISSINFNQDILHLNKNGDTINIIGTQSIDTSETIPLHEFRKSHENNSTKTKSQIAKSITAENERIQKSVNKKNTQTIEYPTGSPIKIPARVKNIQPKVNMRSTEHKNELNDYFENKMEMKRIENKAEQQNYAQLNIKQQQQTFDQNMFHAVSDEKKNIMVKSTLEAKQKRLTKKTLPDKSKTNFVRNNIKNTVLPQILNQYNNGSEIRNAINPISDNEGESIKRNSNLVSQSKHGRNNDQRLSYNSNVLSYDSAEILANYPINTARNIEQRPVNQRHQNLQNSGQAQQEHNSP